MHTWLFGCFSRNFEILQRNGVVVEAHKMGEDFFTMRYAHYKRWPYADRVQRAAEHPHTTIDGEESIMEQTAFCIRYFHFNAVFVTGMEYIQVLEQCLVSVQGDRKSTRLNSSH